jgi:hypothetical protein
MSSSRKTINELASMFQDHVNWLGRYRSVPRRMALRIVNVQAGEVLDRIPRLLALERVVRRISWQWMHEAWDVVTGMTCESPRECAGTRKPIPSGMGGFTLSRPNGFVRRNRKTFNLWSTQSMDAPSIHRGRGRRSAECFSDARRTPRGDPP